MARYFDVTAVTTSVELDKKRKGQAAFTVTNATTASLRGDAVVVPEAGAEAAKYEIDEPSRHFAPGATDQVIVEVTAPAGMPAGTYGFRLRMLLGGGVPEEQFDDSPTVKYLVEKGDELPPKKPFPWWIVIVAALIALVVIGVTIYVLVPKPPVPTPIPTPTAPPPTEPAPIVSGQSVIVQPDNLVDLDTGTVGGPEPDLVFRIFATFTAEMDPVGSATLANAGGTAPGRKACSTIATSAGPVDLLRVSPGTYFCVRTNESNVSQVRLVNVVDPLARRLLIEVTTWPPGP
jgi:hypothetical protein